MKILLIGYVPFNLDAIKGGVESAILNLLRGFSPLQVEVTLLSFNEEVKQPTTISISPNTSILYFPVGRIRSTKLFLLLKGSFVVKKIVKELNPDVVHFQGAGSALLASLLLNRKNVVVTPHGIVEEEVKYKKSFVSRLNHQVVAWIERLTVRSFHHFIFVSDYSKNRFIKAYSLDIHKLHTAIIPNALDLTFVSPKCVEPKHNRILFVGTIRRLKGVDILVNALAKLKQAGIDIELDIVGGFDEPDYRIELLDLLKKHCLENRVTFHGWLGQAELKEVMRTCTLFVQPSRLETFSISTIEAMAMGLIVLVSDTGGMSSLVENGVNGFKFEVENVEELSQLLQRIINEPHLFSEIRNVSQEMVVNRFHPNKVALQTHSFYTEIRMV